MSHDTLVVHKAFRFFYYSRFFLRRRRSGLLTSGEEETRNDENKYSYCKVFHFNISPNKENFSTC